MHFNVGFGAGVGPAVPVPVAGGRISTVAGGPLTGGLLALLLLLLVLGGCGGPPPPGGPVAG